MADFAQQPGREVQPRRTRPGGRCARWSSTGLRWTWSAAGGSPCRTWSRPGCCASTTATSPSRRRRTSLGRRHVALRDDDPVHRARRSPVLLDELRRVLAIDVDCLTSDGFDRVQRLIRPASERAVGAARARAAARGRARPSPARQARRAAQRRSTCPAGRRSAATCRETPVAEARPLSTQTTRRRSSPTCSPCWNEAGLLTRGRARN